MCVKRMCVRETGRFHIGHGSSEMTDMTWTSWEQSLGWSWLPNQDERPAIKMSWSIVSKVAERSSRQRHVIFCDPIALMRWSWMHKRAVSVEWCLQLADWWELSRLLEVRWQHILLFWTCKFRGRSSTHVENTNKSLVNSQCAGAVFYDFVDAFGTMSRNRLHEKIHKDFEIGGLLCRHKTSFLSVRMAL